MENLTATYKTFTVGLRDEIEAVSFQDAAQKIMEKHGLTSVESIAVEYDEIDGGTIELVDCRIVDGRLEYRTHYVIDVKDETEETRERLAFLASGEAIEDQ
jgi:FlaG/FlaF family flagellin (archaellin)